LSTGVHPPLSTAPFSGGRRLSSGSACPGFAGRGEPRS